MNHWLYRWYRWIGIHAAPPGTLFFFVHSLVRRVVHWRIFGYASGNPYKRSTFGGVPYYNLGHVRRTRPVGGIALIYFMGAGDYLMTTPLVRSLHLAYPDLPIYAYASTHSDSVNSPLVLQLLKVNPFVDKVFSYDGRPRSIWTDYDFSDALKDIPKDFVILPVFYEVEPLVYHRTTSLQETFGLPVELPVPAPIAHSAEISRSAATLLRSIQVHMEAAVPTGVVGIHFGARSSGYEYPNASDVVARLIRLGYYVVAFSKVDLRDENLTQIDISQVSPTDSIELLRELATGPVPLFMISVNSLMWPITAALDIPNLGLHTFKDPAIHQYLYPNIFVVTQYPNPQISPSRWFGPPANAFRLRPLNGGVPFTDYNPDFVVDCFQKMTTLVAPARTVAVEHAVHRQVSRTV